MAKGSGPPVQKRNETPQILLERALGAAGEGIVIADARRPDMPLIYVNAAFEVVELGGDTDLAGACVLVTTAAAFVVFAGWSLLLGL